MRKTLDTLNVQEYLQSGREPVMVIPRDPTHTWLVPSRPLQDNDGFYPNEAGLWRRVDFGGFVRVPAHPYRVSGVEASRSFFYFGAICFEAAQALLSMGHRIERLHLVVGGDGDLEALYENERPIGFRFWAGMAVELE